MCFTIIRERGDELGGIVGECHGCASRLGDGPLRFPQTLLSTFVCLKFSIIKS